MAVKETARIEPALSSRVTSVETNVATYVATYDSAITNLVYAITNLLDLVGVTAGAVSGGDIIVRSGSASNPSISFATDRISGVFSPATGQIALTTNGGTKVQIDSTGNVSTGVDNTQSLGIASKRWSTIYAGTGTINTSDARDKTSVTPLSQAEIAAAKDLAKEIGTYQFLNSVAIKGDGARHHIGLTVQRAIEIMESHGLNPFRYGFICHDSWPEISVQHPYIPAVEEVLDDEGNVVTEASPEIETWTEIIQEAGDRYAFRNDQLALFISAGFDARLRLLEER